MKRNKLIVKDVLPLNRDLKIQLLKAIEKGEIDLSNFPEFIDMIEPAFEQIIGMRVIDSFNGKDLF